jgi:hypothetical protein
MGYEAYGAMFNLSIGACELSALLAAALGGIAIAGERADRKLDGAWGVGIVCFVGFATFLFGVAWLLGSLARSGPVSACISIALASAVLFFLEINLQRHDPSNYYQVFCRFALPPLAIGFTSLIAGTLYYLRRVAP